MCMSKPYWDLGSPITRKPGSFAERMATSARCTG